MAMWGEGKAVRTTLGSPARLSSPAISRELWGWLLKMHPLAWVKTPHSLP